MYATPAEVPFPQPDRCQRNGGHFLDPPVAPGALGDIMEAIEGDGTPWSSIEAFLFAREIAEFGALWHGSDWGTHAIMAANPFDGGYAPEMMTADGDAWQWSEPPPDQWRPTVTMQRNSVTVTMYTHSALGSERIMRHTDRYAPRSYVGERWVVVVRQGAAGFVF